MNLILGNFRYLVSGTVDGRGCLGNRMAFL
jgi:hypothetical protein